MEVSSIQSSFNAPLYAFGNPHQVVFLKNFELLKIKYRKLMTPNFEIELLKMFYFSEGQAYFFEKMFSEYEKQSFITNKKVYVFLGLLTINEVEMEKSRKDFNDENWESFAQNSLFTSKEKVCAIIEEIFQNNIRYYKWTHEEDCYLKSLILQNNPKLNKKNCWKLIAKEFNQQNMVSMIRKPSHLRERWENVLKRTFKKGEWSLQEDLLIMNHVKINGTKWAQLAKVMEDRNDHQIKNRFFGLMCEFMSSPIKEIKRRKNYLKPELLEEAIVYIKSRISHK